MPVPIHLQLAQQIVDTLKTICSHDINYIDINGRIFASTDPARVNGYHEGGHRAARLGEIVTIEEDDPVKDVRRGINMPIRYHGKTVAVIGITGDPEGVRRYADLAQRITLLLLREQEVDSRYYDRRTQTGYLVRALIDNEMLPSGFISEVLAKNGMSDDAEQWRTVVIQLCSETREPLASIELAVQDISERMGNCLYAYRFPNEFVILFKESGLSSWKRALRSLASRFSEDIRVGVGSPGRLSRQDLSFQAAKMAIHSLPSGENVAFYESVRLELLLGGVDKAAGALYIRKCLHDLDGEDRELLGHYYASEMSLKETARRCCLHINTLQYRLNRIRERCGLDPRSFRDAAALYAALRLEQMASP